MQVAGLDLVLANARRTVSWLTDYQTVYWTWDHAILHMLDKEYDGRDYHVFAGFPREPGKHSFLVEYAHREQAVEQFGIHADRFYGYWTRGRIPEITGEGVTLERDWSRTSVEAVVQAIQDCGLDNATIGIEEGTLPLNVFRDLRNLLPRVRFQDAGDLLFDLRQVKTFEEIRRFRHAYEVADRTYRRAFARAGTGVTPRELLLEEMDEIYRSGCSFSFSHVHFSSGATDLAVTPPPDRPIEPGDVGLFDLGVVYEGYSTDYARMAEVAPGNEKLRRHYPAILRAREVIERGIRPGVIADDLFTAGARVLEDAGLTASISCLGHGIGLGPCERPFLNAGSQDRIVPGQILVIEIYAEVGGLGPILMEDGGLVTEAGWESFCGLPTDIVQLG